MTTAVDDYCATDDVATLTALRICGANLEGEHHAS